MANRGRRYGTWWRIYRRRCRLTSRTIATITAIGNHGMLKKKKLFIACHAVEQTTMTIASRMSERKAPLRRRGRTYGAAGPGGPTAPYVRPRRRSGAFRSLILLAIVIIVCSTAWHAMNSFFFFNIPWFPIAVLVAIVLLVSRHRRR